MTLDEAIERNRRIANSYKDTAPDCDVARDHAQLADWLEELQLRRGRAKELAALEDLRQRVIETGRLCVASGVRAATQTLIDLTNEEIVKQEEEQR